MTKSTARLFTVCGLVLLLAGVSVLFSQQLVGWLMVIAGAAMVLVGLWSAREASRRN